MQMLACEGQEGPIWVTYNGGEGVVRFWNPGLLSLQPSLLFVTLLYSQLVMGHLTNI